MILLKKLLALIPAKTVAKYLPQLLAFLLTKVMKWLSDKYPDKLVSVIAVSYEVTEALETTLNAGKDNKFTPEEIKEIQKEWDDVFGK